MPVMYRAYRIAIIAINSSTANRIHSHSRDWVPVAANIANTKEPATVLDHSVKETPFCVLSGVPSPSNSLPLKILNSATVESSSS